MKIELGREARDCLTSLQTEVTWREYESLGHWYSGHMLGALAKSLKEMTGWAAESETYDRENSNTGAEINREGGSSGCELNDVVGRDHMVSARLLMRVKSCLIGLRANGVFAKYERWRWLIYKRVR